MIWLSMGLSLAQAAPCSSGMLDEVVGALQSSPAAYQVQVASYGLSMTCSKPDALVKGAAMVDRVPPSQRAAVDMQVALGTAKEWMAMCPGGIDVLTGMAAVAADQKRAFVWKGCELKDRGWMTAAEWNQGDGLVVIALVGAHVLGSSGVSDKDVRTWVRAAAGVRSSGGAKRIDPWEDPFVELPDLALGPEPSRGRGGSASGERDAGFARKGRVAPDWGRKARKEGGRCTLRVFVAKDGSLRNVVPVACPDALVKDATKAVEASTLRARRKGGQAAPGRFEVTYRVK